MSKKKEKQMQILRNYFSIRGKVATLKLVYDTYSELINPNFGDDKIEKLNDKLFSDIREAVSLLPRNFKLNVHIIIKDFGDYTKDECEKIIKQNVYLYAYQLNKESNKKRANGWSMIGIGAVVLLVSYFLQNFGLWFDLVNISGTLFVWEGAYTAFLERNQETRETKAFAKAIKKMDVEGLEETK